MPQVLKEAELEYADEFGVTFPMRLTQQEYEQLPGVLAVENLIYGELILSPHATTLHSLLVKRISLALQPLEVDG